MTRWNFLDAAELAAAGLRRIFGCVKSKHGETNVGEVAAAAAAKCSDDDSDDLFLLFSRSFYGGFESNGFWLLDEGN